MSTSVEELQQRVEALERALKEATKAPAKLKEEKIKQLPKEVFYFGFSTNICNIFNFQVSEIYEFPNHPADEKLGKKEGGDRAWIGIANSTKHNLKVKTELGGNTAGDIFSYASSSLDCSLADLAVVSN